MVIIEALEHQADKVTLTIITKEIMTLITMVTKITTITVTWSVSFKLHVSTMYLHFFVAKYFSIYKLYIFSWMTLPWEAHWWCNG